MNDYTMDTLKTGNIFKHYKTKTLYEILMLGVQENTLEPCVIYCAVNNRETIWVRNVSSWMEFVEYNGKHIPRFEKKSP